MGVPKAFVAKSKAGVGAAVAGDGAGHVVVAQGPVVAGAPTGACSARVSSMGAAQPAGVPGAGEEVEAERGVRFVGAEVAGEAFWRPAARLADEHAAVPRAPARSGDVVEFVLSMYGGSTPFDEVGAVAGAWRQRGGVDADAGDAAFEPERSTSRARAGRRGGPS